jgi:hypothetical protein
MNSTAGTDPRRTRQIQLSAVHLAVGHRKDDPLNEEARPSSAIVPIAGLLDDPTTCLAPLISMIVKPSASADFVNILLTLRQWFFSLFLPP